MIKLLIFFRKPTNTDVFEDRFATHVQLINAMPNIKRTVVNRAIGAPRGEPAYTLIHEVFFADLAAATYALNTPEGRTAGTDMLNFARDAVTMFAEVWGEDVAETPAPSAEPELAPAAAAASAAVAELANATPLVAPSAEQPYTIEDIIAMNTPEVVVETAEANEANIEAATAIAEGAVAEAAVAEVIAEEAISLEPQPAPPPSRPSLGESLLS